MRAHRTDLVSLAFGLLFLGLSAWWLLAQILGLALPPVGWFLAGALLLVGVLGLLGALRSARHANQEVDAGAPTAAPTAVPDGWTAPGRADEAPTGTDRPDDRDEPGDAADEWPTTAVTDPARDAVRDRTADSPDERPPA